jgi:hypothetical protein
VYVRAGLLPRWPLLYLTGEPDRTAPEVAVSRTNPEDAAAADGQLTGGADRRADYQHWLRDSGHEVIAANGPRLVAAGAATDTTLHHLTVGDQHDAEPALRSVLNSLPGPVTLCLPGLHPALIGLLRHGYRIDDWDLAMATTDLTLPAHWVYSPGLG